MFASMKGHHRVAELLLDHGASIDLQDSNKKWSALMIACEKNHLELVKLLLDKKLR